MSDISRRSFLGMGGCALAVAIAEGAPSKAAAKPATTPMPAGDALIAKYLKPTKVSLAVGAEKPFTAIHFSDTHVSQSDAQDLLDGDERALALYNARYPRFPASVQSLAAVCAYGRRQRVPLLNTGDVFDFRSEANIRCIARAFKDLDVFSCLGNHEGYGHHGGGMNPATPAARDALRARYEQAFGNPLLVASRVINGVNFVAFDNGGLQRGREAEAVAAVKREFARNMPVVLMCHMPVYTPQLIEDMCEKRRRKRPDTSLRAYVLLGEDALKSKAHPAARDLVSFLRRQKNLKAILAGHLHFEWNGVFNDSVPMLVAGGNFEGRAYEISFT